jgi:hypothetical protein
MQLKPTNFYFAKILKFGCEGRGLRWSGLAFSPAFFEPSLAASIYPV